jgi:hypothetical protein
MFIDITRRHVLLAFLILAAFNEAAHAQNYGLRVWGSAYPNPSTVTPQPTPAAIGTPSTKPETVLPINAYAVNTNYIVSKEINTTSDQNHALYSFDRKIDFLHRNVPRTGENVSAAFQNFISLNTSEGTFEPSLGTRSIRSSSGLCQEEYAFQTNGSCSTIVTRTNIDNYDQVASSESEYQAWLPSNIASRPYICKVEQIIDNNGARLKYTNSYKEENRLSLFVDGKINHSYRVRFNLAIYGLEPYVTNLFSQSNLQSLMSPRKYKALDINQIKISNFTLVPGSNSVFEGVIHGSTPYPLIFSVPARGSIKRTNGLPSTSYNCLTYSVSYPRVIQDLGD